MGQKVNPNGFRVGVKGIKKPWMSRWYANPGRYADLFHEDLKLRAYLEKELDHAGVSRVEIERAANKIRVHVYTSRPGIVIGKKGTGIDTLRGQLQKKIKDGEVFVEIHEVRKAEIDARLVAKSIALQLERRVAFRRAMKKAVQSALKFGAKGIRVECSGRLGGAEIARREWYREGRVPLHTLRADIEFARAEASTTYGKIGVKVWIFKGEVIEKDRPDALGREGGSREAA